MTPTLFPALRANLSIDAERRFFAWLCSAILALAVIGFARTYLLVPVLGMPSDTPRYTPLIHLHAAIMFAWCLLLMAQAWLVAGARVALHRRLGMAGFALYLAMVVVGPMVALHSVTRYGPDELSFLAVSLGNVFAYTLLLGAAFFWRGRADLHKRLMCLGMVTLLTAPFGRLAEWPWMLQHVIGPGLVVVALFLVAIVLSPIAGIIPSQATAPALILVGYLMFTQIKGIDVTEMEDGFPALLTIILMPLTYDITVGIGAGFISWVVLKIFKGKLGEVHPLMWVVALGFLVFFLQDYIGSFIK